MMPRVYTNRLLEMVDEEIVDKHRLIWDLLRNMSEEEVKAFYNRMGYADVMAEFEKEQ